MFSIAIGRAGPLCLIKSTLPVLYAAALCAGGSAHGQQSWDFACGPHKGPGAVHVLNAGTTYAKPEGALPADSRTVAFGFDLNTAPTIVAQGACTGDKPFFFSIAVPDGNYEVKLALGSPGTASTTTVRAESRRLMVNQLALRAGATQDVIFNVNVRTAAIAATGAAKPASPDTAMPANSTVKLKPREIGALDWDEKLTLEFNGDHPSVRSISVRAVSNVPTIYLAGDSTVVDQDKEPWAAWGQMLPAFFGPSVSVANEAESGETIRSFVGERRLAKIMSTIKPGDFLLVQFAHNDQKLGSGYVPAATDFKTYLLSYIEQARSHGATPILVTAMNRRSFDEDGKIKQTLGDYPQAMREVAAEQKIGLIDLNAMSKTLFEALGPQETLHAFVHYPANTFPDQDKELKDDTHFNSYGAYELARAIVQNIRDQHLPLERFLRPGIAAFDPAHPEPFAAWKLPPSPSVSAATPYGR